MIRILRAFAWLRWRMLLNSLERRSSRDAIERFSIAVEQLAPTIAAIVMLPSMLGLAGLAGYAGWTLGSRRAAGLHFRGAAIPAARGMRASPSPAPSCSPAAIAPTPFACSSCPIPRGVLYLAHAVGALADPWVLLAAAVVLGLPLGLAAGGSVGARGAGRGGGPAADRGPDRHLARRLGRGAPVRARPPARGIARAARRRRAADDRDAAGAHGRAPPLQPRSGGPSRESSAAPATSSGRCSPWCRPSSMSARCGRHPIADRRHQPPRSPGSWARRGTSSAGVRGVRARPRLDGDHRAETSGGRRRETVADPGPRSDTSAVAINQLRLALRTPRGRATLLSPIVVFGMFAVMTLRSGGSGRLRAARPARRPRARDVLVVRLAAGASCRWR